MQKRGNIFWAFVLIAIGLWMLAQNLKIPLPGVGAMWPALIVVAGLWSLGSFITGHDRNPDAVFFGVAATLLGLFFFVFTLQLRLPLAGWRESGADWGDVARLWPGFVVIGGLAFLSKFIVDRNHDWGEFVIGLLALIIGVIAFPFTLGIWSGELGKTLLNLWPVLLIVVGLAALLQAVFRKR